MAISATTHDAGNPTPLAPVNPRQSRATHAVEFTVLVDAEGVIISLSPTITSALGIPVQQLLQSHIEALVHPDDATVLCAALATSQSGSQPGEVACRLRDMRGSWRRVCINAASMVAASGGTDAVLLTVRDAPDHESARDGLHPHEHFVQLYESDDFLIESVAEFIGTGLAQGDVGLVIATHAHRVGVEQLLRSRRGGSEADLCDGYIALDAAEILDQFMVDGMPDADRFNAVVGALITHAVSQGRHVSAFGEMVALLWEQGQPAAAIRLEALWNDLRAEYPHFTLCCAYPMRNFVGESKRSLFTEMCAQHSHVVPDESYTALDSVEERMRAISSLQQKARSLDYETRERLVAEERLRVMAEAMPQKIYTARPDGAIDYLNPQWARFTGLRFEAIRGWGWTQFIHPDDLDKNLRLWRSSLASGEPFYIEHRFRRADGVYCWHMTRAIPMRDTDGAITMWAGSSTDIDEQKQLEQRKNAFISMASHELKTPVTSLKGFTQILQRRLRQQNADPSTLLFVDRMDAQLRRMTNLISDLLDLSKMQTGALSIQETLFDLDALVRETVENVQAISVTHTIRVEGATRATIHGDPDRIGQALTNVLANAIKYSPDADTVIVHLRADDAWAEIAVQDFGLGIAEKYHERIFDQFFQANDAADGTFPGLGIGLYIAHTFVARHGGRLWVESAPGAGSLFRFTLPLASKLSQGADVGQRGQAGR